MTTTTPNARDEMSARVVEVRDTLFPATVIYWQGVDTLAPPAADVEWWRVTIQHSESEQASLACDEGKRRWRRYGILTVQCFAPLEAGGLTRAEEMACAVRDAFQSRATDGGVWFKRCTIREVGPDKSWYLFNASIPFEYDEVK